MTAPTIFDPGPEAPPPRPIAVIDFEASRLPGAGSYPIEVGIAFPDAPEATLSWLIQPTTRWETLGVWDGAAARLHGISQAQLRADRTPVEQVAAELAAAAEGHSVLSDMVADDNYWLRVLYAEIGSAPPFRLEGVRALLQEMLGRDADARIEEAENLARDRFPSLHRAGPDARRVAEIVRMLAEPQTATRIDDQA
jgi:hypothetical protein